MNFRNCSQNTLIGLIVLWAVTAIYVQDTLAVADNGDFSRAMGWITSGPVGIEPNWPEPGAPGWHERFFNYWQPHWKLVPDGGPPPTPSSTRLLWWPGAQLNYHFYSPDILYLPLLSWPMRLLVLGVLLALLGWIRQQPRYSRLLLLTLGLPALLMLTTSDYLGVYTTFYQESGSFLYLFLFLGLLVAQRQNHSWWLPALTVSASFLIAITKAAYFYWPLIGVPAALWVWGKGRPMAWPLPVMAVLAGGVLTFSAYDYTQVSEDEVNAYHSLFHGALSFSRRPLPQLQGLGFDDAAEGCINHPAYSDTGIACREKYAGRLLFSDTLRVMWREPLVAVRMARHVLDNMNDISLDYLGRYTAADPRNERLPAPQSGKEQRTWDGDAPILTLLNGWSWFKYHFFPTGIGLAVTLAGFVVWFGGVLWRGASSEAARALALAGLVATVGVGFDMGVAILGDGKYELIKHLLLANLLFDVGLLCFVNSVLIYGMPFVGRLQRI